MSSFAEALALANIEVSDSAKNSCFDSIEDVVLPFKQISPSPICYKELNDAEYVRSTAKELDVGVLQSSIKPFKGDVVYKWILANHKYIRLISTGGTRRVNKRKVKSLFGDRYIVAYDLEQDTNYGFCCMSFYVRWNPYSLSFSVMNNTHEHTSTEEIFEFLNEKLELCKQGECLFIPLDMSDANNEGISFSYKCSSLGQCILNSNNSKIKEAVERQTSEGYFIKPRGYYFIRRNSRGDLYFKYDKQSSESSNKYHS